MTVGYEFAQEYYEHIELPLSLAYLEWIGLSIPIHENRVRIPLATRDFFQDSWVHSAAVAAPDTCS